MTRSRIALIAANRDPLPAPRRQVIVPGWEPPFRWGLILAAAVIGLMAGCGRGSCQRCEELCRPLALKACQPYSEPSYFGPRCTCAEATK